jgi:hypothetical protein
LFLSFLFETIFRKNAFFAKSLLIQKTIHFSFNFSKSTFITYPVVYFVTCILKLTFIRILNLL